MAWTYSGNPADSDKDHVRFLIGDTDDLDPLLQDEEIDFLLAQHETPIKAAVACCRVLVAKFTRQVNYTIGPESVQAGERAKAFQHLMEELKDAGRATGIPSSGSPVNGTFDLGMHDNKFSGRRGLIG